MDVKNIAQLKAEGILKEFAERAELNRVSADQWFDDQCAELIKKATSKLDPFAAVESFEILLQMAGM